MSETSEAGAGRILWHDLTVEDAEGVRDFYRDVVGWSAEPVEMDGYADFSMIPPGSSEPVAGVCHARGPNAELPSQWLVYFGVGNLDASISRCVEGGGEVIAGPKPAGEGRFCVIRDPAGAMAALYESRSSER